MSAGPIKTLAASGIGNFGKLLAWGRMRRCAAT
jgi:enoyl-[acyl-carrier-protein] reductase (NADH)